MRFHPWLYSPRDCMHRRPASLRERRPAAVKLAISGIVCGIVVVVSSSSSSSSSSSFSFLRRFFGRGAAAWQVENREAEPSMGMQQSNYTTQSCQQRSKSPPSPWSSRENVNVALVKTSIGVSYLGGVELLGGKDGKRSGQSWPKK